MLDMDCAAVQEICALLRDKEFALRNYLDSLEHRALTEEDGDPDDLRTLRGVIAQMQSNCRTLSKMIVSMEKTMQAYRRSERNALAILHTQRRRLPDGTIGINDLSGIHEKMKKYKIMTTR